MSIRPAAAFLFVCPVCAGCFGGYAYPTAAYVPRASLEKPAADAVHVFRVDILDASGSIEFAGADEYRFRELPVSEAGSVPAQTKVGVGGRWWTLFGALNYTQRLHPTIRVRIYRPGYETVDLKPWTRAKIVWRPAATPVAREAAVDDLISTRDTNEYYKIAPEAWKNERADYGLAPPTTDAQRAALLFIAGEYDRLVSDAATRGDTRAVERLQEKARQLRTLALE
jgi:hypothetical protein